MEAAGNENATGGKRHTRRRGSRSNTPRAGPGEDEDDLMSKDPNTMKMGELKQWMRRKAEEGPTARDEAINQLPPRLQEHVMDMAFPADKAMHHKSPTHVSATLTLTLPPC